MKMTKDANKKKELANKTNDIQANLQDIYLELEELNDYDLADSALKSVINAISAVHQIRERILTGQQTLQNDDNPR